MAETEQATKRTAAESSKLRRNRGYVFEYNLTDRFMDLQVDGWNARRLGGSSTGLPDIVAMNNKTGILVTIECKSGEANTLHIPDDQLERCRETMRLFSYYPHRFFIAAFKFKGLRKKRKLCYRFGVFDSQQADQLAGSIAYSYSPDILNATLAGALHGVHRTAPLSYKGLTDFEAMLATVNGYVNGKNGGGEKI